MHLSKSVSVRVVRWGGGVKGVNRRGHSRGGGNDEHELTC